MTLNQAYFEGRIGYAEYIRRAYGMTDAIPCPCNDKDCPASIPAL